MKETKQYLSTITREDFDEKDVLDVCAVIADTYERNRCYSKLAEECIELAEVAIKMANKAEGFQPPIEKIVEKAGDIMFRLGVVMFHETFDMEAAIKERIINKAYQLVEYLKSENKLK